MNSPVAHTKTLLRVDARRRRVAFVEQLGPAERQAQEQALVAVLTPLLQQAKVIAGYHSVGSEIDVGQVLRWAADHGLDTLLPAFDAPDAAMTFRRGPASDAGPYGIPQPSVHARESRPDLIFVPLLVIDGIGTRLGQGSGHYDRVLADLRASGATLIGVGWQLQRVDDMLPRDVWDVPLDGFASPKGYEMFR